VENKPFLMRVTYYGMVSPKQVNERGHGVIEFLGSMKTFISQEDRKEENAMVMKTSVTEDGEMMASFTTGFDIDMISEIDRDEVVERSPSDDESVLIRSSTVQ
jgi:hypothetical protein